MESEWGACLQAIEGHKGAVYSVSFSSNSTRIISGSIEKTIKIWDASSGACIHTLEGHSGWVLSVIFSSDCTHIGSGSSDNTVRIGMPAVKQLEPASEFLKAIVAQLSQWPFHLMMHWHTYVTSGSSDKTVKIWDTSSGVCLQTLEGHSDWVQSVVFSPNNTYIASKSVDNTVRIWDASSGACLHTLEGHNGSIQSVAFASDDTLTYVASGSSDKSVQIWDASSGACLLTFEGQGYCVIFDAATSSFHTEMGVVPWNRILNTQKDTNICETLQNHSYGLNAN